MIFFFNYLTGESKDIYAIKMLTNVITKVKLMVFTDENNDSWEFDAEATNKVIKIIMEQPIKATTVLVSLYNDVKQLYQFDANDVKIYTL